MILKFIDIWFTRGSDIILRNISFTIDRSEIVFIRGRSGVGKTTLAKIATLLLQPSRGSIVFLGRDVSRMNSYERDLLRLQYIGYIDQMYRLIPHITVLDNIILPLRLLGHGKKESIRYVEEVLSRLGIDDIRDRYPEEISGGQRQRAAIARALIKKPMLIVADEPFSNLDEETISRVLELFQEYAKRFGAGVLITTTDLSTRYPCTKEYILRDGSLYEKT